MLTGRGSVEEEGGDEGAKAASRHVADPDGLAGGDEKAVAGGRQPGGADVVAQHARPLSGGEEHDLAPVEGLGAGGESRLDGQEVVGEGEAEVVGVVGEALEQLLDGAPDEAAVAAGGQCSVARPMWAARAMSAIDDVGSALSCRWATARISSGVIALPGSS